MYGEGERTPEELPRVWAHTALTRYAFRPLARGTISFYQGCRSQQRLQPGAGVALLNTMDSRMRAGQIGGEPTPQMSCINTIAGHLGQLPIRESLLGSAN